MTSSRTVHVRRPRFTFSDVPRYWFGGSCLATQLGNAMHLLFPAGERFLIRAGRAYLRRLEVEDAELAARTRAFFIQEALHFGGHEAFLRALRRDGVHADRFMRIFELVAFRLLEPLAGDRLRLATAVAFEHLFSTVAAAALERGVVAAHVAPPIRELLLWHAAEEIEHKAVLFDVLARVAPGYPLRMAGMAIASLTWLGFVGLATAALLAADEHATLTRVARDARRGLSLGAVRARDLARAVTAYARPSFHPDEVDNYPLADAYVASDAFRAVTAA